jgi:gluconolactonase
MIMNSEFRRIVSEGVKVERIGTGFQFTEGPVWNVKGGYLLFSDIPANRIIKWTPEDGISDFRVPSGKSNGLTLDRKGRLIACEHANRRVSRTEEDGAVVTIASHYKGKKLNSPNDVVVKSDGSVYFTDPPYGLDPIFGIFEEQELPFNGVYRVSPNGDDLSLLIDDSVPNGLAFSPNESLLYVADTEMNHLRVFDVKDNGKTANGCIFAEISGEPLAPDGLKVDSEGNVYVTGKGGIWVLNPEGRRLGIISVPELPANLCWGDRDWKTLYITARTSLYRVRLNIAGIPLP